ncbi:head-tail adaptor [Actinomadura coerulea]|uniref:Head-tail adaptor n=1 Tax=Actinomadura coerulea TaxID=46159 RepID=A0A7X0G6U9_9ACTN|nr:head-tail adaptor [Actinomadura coerulea]
MLRDRREVFRPTRVSDGMGGGSTTFVKVGTVRCKVDLPGAEERESADQWGAEHTHSVFLLPSADVRRGDELRGGDLVLRVLTVVCPSSPRYRKARCSAVQPKG